MILVTGCAGFIGSNFVHTWLEGHDEPVVNLDKLTYAGNLDNLSALAQDARHIFVQGDIGDRSVVDVLLAKYKPRAVLNFAAESHVDRSIHGPSDFIQTNVVGTFNLLESVLAYWSTLPEAEKKAFRCLHVSTDEVYGTLSAEDPPFAETNPFEPNSPYAASKASSDHLVRAWHHTYGLPVLTTNCSNNYGPFHFPEKLIPLSINNIKNNLPIPVYGKGENIRDWLWVEDHARAIDLIFHQAPAGTTYNIGGHNEWTNIDLIRLLCKIMDQKLGREPGASAKLITFVTDRAGHDLRYAIDSSKLQADLGWKPSLQFEEGLEKTVDWFLNNEDWLQSVTSGNYQSYYNDQYGKR